MSEVHPVDQLEPGALTSSALVPDMAGQVDALRMQFSIAISLKRIADALEGKDSYALNNMMENAGGAFALGMRGR